jgi:hypothetical protein
MSEQVNVPADDNCTDVSDIDEFYVSRINWLITVGRDDLIDEIADDCERRRSTPVEMGTRLAVARLRHTLRRPHAARQDWRIPHGTR